MRNLPLGHEAARGPGSQMASRILRNEYRSQVGLSSRQNEGRHPHSRHAFAIRTGVYLRGRDSPCCNDTSIIQLVA